MIGALHSIASDDLAHVQRSKPVRTPVVQTSNVRDKFALQFTQRPGERMKRKVHDVAPGGNDDAAENAIGGEDLSLGAIDGRPPPRIPDIVEQENSTAGSIHLHENFGVGVLQQPGTAGRRSTTPAKSRRSMLQQHGLARINIRPPAPQTLTNICTLPPRL